MNRMKRPLSKFFMRRFYFLAVIFGFFIFFSVILFISAVLNANTALKFLGTRAKLTSFSLALVKNSDTAFRIGNYFFNGGAYDLNLAEKGYHRALELDASRPLAHYQLGRVEFIRGNLSRAFLEIQTEIERHPNVPNSWYVRGLIWGYLGRYEKAEEDFREFIRRVPNQWAGYNDLAWIQNKLGKYDEAERTVGEAFRRIPAEKDRNPWLWTSLGVSFLNLRKYQLAQDAFETSLRIVADFTPEYFFSAYPGNDPRGAKNALSQFIATDYFNMALVYEKIGEKEAAIAEYEKILSLPEESIQPLDRSSIEKRIRELASQ